MTRRTVAAVDLGSESARVVLVGFDGQRMDASVRSRSAHAAAPVDGVLRWDLAGLWAAVSAALARAAADLRAAGSRLDAVGVDAWGVDYGLLDAAGDLVDAPTCYRDPRQVAGLAEAVRRIGADRWYALTGCLPAPILTAAALVADADVTGAGGGRLARAARLLMLPDVVHHLLSGSRTTEHTAASTTGLYHPGTGSWVPELVAALELPDGLLPEVVAPGTDLGPVTGDLAGALAGTRVVAPAAHDTASAVLATPLDGPGALFLSSGTWSLLGAERTDVLATPAAARAGLTNEGGHGGAVHLLHNGMGLWLLQECRRQWAREGRELSYADLADLAAREPALRSVVDADAPELLAPGDVPARLRALCEAAGEPVPESVGAVARCVVDSLALGYRRTAEDLAAVTGRAATSITVTGGGSTHAALLAATADATGLPVHRGPAEATALGNAAAQLVALGELSGAADARRAVAAGGALPVVEPGPAGPWDDAAGRLRARAARCGAEAAP